MTDDEIIKAVREVLTTLDPARRLVVDRPERYPELAYVSQQTTDGAVVIGGASFVVALADGQVFTVKGSKPPFMELAEVQARLTDPQ